MTKDDRETLRQLEYKATKGPWTLGNPNYPDDVMGANGIVAETWERADSELIAALRTHATDLLDAHETLEQVREWAERESFDAPTSSYYRAMLDVLELLGAKRP